MANYEGLGYDKTSARNRTGLASDTIDFSGNVSIKNNLDVGGTIISRDEERVLVADNFLDINFAYITNTGLAGGIAVNFLPTATGVTINTTAGGKQIVFTAQSGATNPNLNCNTDSDLPAGTFAAGDIIQIAGTTNAENDGFYIVNTNAVAGTLEIMDVNDTINMKAAQVNFTAETENTSNAVTIFKVTLSLLQANSATGVFEVQEGSTNAEFATFKSLGGSLQVAYDLGREIVTDATGDILFTLSTDAQGFSVEGAGAGTGDVSIGGATTVSSFTVGSGGAVSLAGAAASNLTTSVGELTLQATQDAGGVTINAGTGGIDLDCTSAGSGSGNGAVSINAGATSKIDTSVGNMTLSASAANGNVTVNAGTGGFDVDATAAGSGTGDGAITMNAAAASTIDVAGANLSLSTTTSGTMDLTSAGTLDLNGVAVNIDSTGAMDITAADGQTLSVNHGGGSALAFSAAGQVDLTGESTAAMNIGTTSAALSLSTTTAGEIDITSAGNLDLNGVATTIDGTAGVAIAGSGAASSFASTAQNLTLSTATSGNVVVSSAGNVDVDGGKIQLDSTDDSNFTMAAAVAAPKKLSISATNSDGGGSAELSLSSETVTVEAVKNATISAFSAPSSASFSKGAVLYMLTTGKIAAADADAIATSRVIGVAAAAAGGADVDVQVINYGVTTLVADSQVPANKAGTPCWVSLNAGEVTTSPPSATGDVVYQVGIIILSDNASPKSNLDVLLQPQFIMENG